MQLANKACPICQVLKNEPSFKHLQFAKTCIFSGLKLQISTSVVKHLNDVPKKRLDEAIDRFNKIVTISFGTCSLHNMNMVSFGHNFKLWH